MSEFAALESQIQRLWDEAQAMLRSSQIDLAPAITLVNALRGCAEKAVVFGLVGGEGQLRRAADELEARIREEA